MERKGRGRVKNEGHWLEGCSIYCEVGYGLGLGPGLELGLGIVNWVQDAPCSYIIIPNYLSDPLSCYSYVMYNTTLFCTYNLYRGLHPGSERVWHRSCARQTRRVARNRG